MIAIFIKVFSSHFDDSSSVFYIINEPVCTGRMWLFGSRVQDSDQTGEPISSRVFSNPDSQSLTFITSWTLYCCLFSFVVCLEKELLSPLFTLIDIT